MKKTTASECTKYVVLILLLFTFQTSLFSQIDDEYRKIDSLQKLLTVDVSDSTKITIWLQIANQYNNNSERERAREYAMKGFLLSDRINNKLLKADALLIIGKLELSSYGPRDQSTRHLLKALEIYTLLKNHPGIAATNLQLGVLSYDMENYKDASEYFLNTIDFGSDNKALVATSHYLLALCYSELGEFTKAQEMFDIAIVEYGKENPIFNLQVHTFIGKLYSNQGDYYKAINSLLNSIDSNINEIDSVTFSPAFSFLSTAYLKIGDPRNAIKYGTLAYKFSKGLGSYIIYIREAEENLHKSYKMIDNIDSAYFYLNELSILKDSITNNSVLQRVAEMKGKFDFEQEMNARKADQALKDAISAKELEREKLLRNIFLIGFFLLLFSAGLFFYQRNKISKEKRRSDDLLLNILPAETAEELKQKGSAEAKLFDLATVIFTDFKGFTELSEKLSPAQLVSEIHSYFSAFDTIMEKHGIEKIKTIGDSYMAASGLPTPTLKSTRNAVMAALEMFAYLKIRQQSAGIPVFEMRCGLHTGPIVAGIVGIKKFQYDIWGDTVNTASRIENNGEVGKVNISRATYELLKNDESFVFEPRGKISVKGKGDLKMYYVSLKS